MGELLWRTLRKMVRWWPLLVLFPLAGVLGWAMLSINADAYQTFVYNDPQAPDEILDGYHFDVAAVYTSGLGWVQLLALLVGAVITVRDPRLTGRPAAELLPDTSPGLLLVGKASVAAMLAVALALVDLQVVLPRAEARLADHWALTLLAQAGAPPPSTPLLNTAVWTTIQCAVANAPLFAIFGVGLGAWAGRWWLPHAAFGFPTGSFLLHLVQDRGWIPNSGILDVLSKFLMFIVLVPVLPFVLLWYLTLTPTTAPIGVLVSLVVATGTLLLGNAATRRRLAPPTPAAASASPKANRQG